jgi:hypothetical protein
MREETEMEAQSFELNVGWSPAGGFVHSADADLHGTFSSLNEAKSAAEDHAARKLEWTWLPERAVHRADIGHELAAEISPRWVVSGISVNTSLL